MSLWICTDCTAAYSVGAPKCPQCASTEHVEEGAAEMAKITVHGGATNAAADEVEGGEDVSAGTSSSTPSEKDSSSPEQSEKPDPSPAPTTASRSVKARTGKSSARGTDGDQTEASSETGSTDDEGA